MKNSKMETQLLLKKILGCSTAELYEILFNAKISFMNFSVAMKNPYYDKQSERLEQLTNNLKPHVLTLIHR